MKKVLLRAIYFLSFAAFLLIVFTVYAKPTYRGVVDVLNTVKPVADGTYKKSSARNIDRGVIKSSGELIEPMFVQHVVVPTFNYAGSVSTHAIPADAFNIKITATGGSGGNMGANPGGRGAVTKGSYGVSIAGQTVSVLAGQKGGTGSLFGGGGGGGSFVYISGTPNTLLIAAGGGGGAGASAVSGTDDFEHQIDAHIYNGTNATTIAATTKGNYGLASIDLDGGIFGANGNGGGNATDGAGAPSDEGAASGGGAGWNPSINDNNFVYLRGTYHGNSPQDLVNPGRGGDFGGVAPGGYGGGGGSTGVRKKSGKKCILGPIFRFKVNESR